MCNHIVPAFACADCGADYGAPLGWGERRTAFRAEQEAAQAQYIQARKAQVCGHTRNQATPEDLSVDRTFENETRLHR